MKRETVILLIAFVLGSAFGCGRSAVTTSNKNANANSNTIVSNTNANTAPNETQSNTESDVKTTTGPDGVKTETRVFKKNDRVSKAVVTTRNGRRSGVVYTPSGERKNVPEDKIDLVLQGTADAVADAVGIVKKKSTAIASGTKEKGTDIGEATADATKKVIRKSADTLNKVGTKAKKILIP
jgi:hypothetical protein